ncbi:ankyrin repeat-containing domain protein [Trichoderma evansii]
MDSNEGLEKKLEDLRVNAEQDSRSHEDQEMTESKASLGSDDASWVVVSDPLEKSSASEPGDDSIRNEPAAGDETKHHENNIDVGQYIESALAGEDYKFWDDSVKTEVKEQLIKNADGMLQFAIDQLNILKDKKTSSDKSILEALRGLPQNIDTTYDKILLSTDERLRPQIISSLKWVAFSIDSLDVSLLSEVFTLHLDLAQDLDEAEAFSANDILKYFPGILVDKDNCIQFDSLYIKEYLTSNRILNSPVSAFSFTANDAHLHITKTCLEYHLQCNPSDNSTISTIVEEQDEENTSKLKSYAAKNWVMQLENVPRSSWPPEIFQAANLALNVRSRSLYSMIDSIVDRPFSLDEAWLNPLIYTAYLNACEVTEMLISEGLDTHEYITQSDLDAGYCTAISADNYEAVYTFLSRCNLDIRDGDATFINAIVELAAGGNLHFVQEFMPIYYGEKYPPMIYSKALDLVARKGDLEMVEYLALSKAKASKYALKAVAGSPGDSPLALECLRLLLDNTPGIRLEGALCKAASEGNWKIFELLLSRGADINTLDGRYGTPLHMVCAAFDMDESRIEYLLNLGADPKIKGGMHGTALQAACYSYAGRDEKAAIRVAKLLLAHGADINATGGEQDSALKNACASKGKDRISWYSLVELLLQNGADINAKGGPYDTALQVACHVGHADIVRLLLDWGAIVNPGGEGYVHGYVHAIIAASFTRPRDGYEGDIEMVQLLLDHGANVNQTGSNVFGSALQAASTVGNMRLVRFLLDHGAEIDMEFANSGTALKAACSWGYNEIARLLLDRGADVNAGGRNAGVIIQTACWAERSNDEMLHMLLDHGADIRLTGFTYVPLLHIAAISDGIQDNAVLKRLLDLGADINELDNNRGTPLHAVLRKSYADNSIKPSRIRFLIEHGADVNLVIPTFGFGSPLHHLCANPVYDSNKYPPQEAAALLFELCPQLDVNAQSGRYGTALQAAVFCDLEETVNVLLSHGADVNVLGGRYNNALNAAVVRGFWNIVKMLLDKGATPDCHRQDELDKKWLAKVEKEDGKRAVERYKKFWEVERKKFVERQKELEA